MFAQFLSFEWRNGSQNRNVLEKLSKTSPFWKFWFSGQGQKSAWSKHFLSLFLFLFFFFFFFRRFGRVKFPGRSGLNLDKRVSSGWRHPWRHSAGTCGTCEGWRHPWRHRSRAAGASSGGPNRRVGLKAAPPNLLAARGGACLGFWALNFWVLLI